MAAALQPVEPSGAAVLVVDDDAAQASRHPGDAGAAGVHGRRSRLRPRSAARGPAPAVRRDSDGRPDADAGRLRDGQADPAAARVRAHADHLRDRVRTRRDRDGGRLCQRSRRLHLHADHPRRAAGEGRGVRLPLPAGRGAEAVARRDHGAQRRAARQRGARPGGAAERGGRDRHGWGGGPDRVVQPVGAPPVRLSRGGGRRAAAQADRGAQPSRRLLRGRTRAMEPVDREGRARRRRPRRSAAARTARASRWRWT